MSSAQYYAAVYEWDLGPENFVLQTSTFTLIDNGYLLYNEILKLVYSVCICIIQTQLPVYLKYNQIQVKITFMVNMIIKFVTNTEHSILTGFLAEI